MTGIDPSRIRTRQALTVQLAELFHRGGWSVHRLADASGLSPATVLNLINGKTGVPRTSTVEAFVAACGHDPQLWIEARGRVIQIQTSNDAHLTLAEAAPVGAQTTAVLVENADPQLLGVHAAVKVEGAVGYLPAYVQRDCDAGPRGIRATLRDTAKQGGFVLLVGPSSVGKTRSAYEAIIDLLPKWSLMHPATADDLARLAADPPAQTVVWLNELQRYLDEELRLTTTAMRTLLQATKPVVLIGTLWPERYTSYLTLPDLGAQDTNAPVRHILELSVVVRIPQEFTAAEKARAKKLAATDPRLHLALASTDYGVTQVLAAAPQLVDHWDHADPYAKAVIDAAIDATHRGVHTPLPAALLRQAAPGYCDARVKAAAPADWWERSLAYATARLHGAVSVLAPVAASGSGMGDVTGYVVADYLLQRTILRRLYAQPPGSLWEACLDHITDPRDNLSLCNEAYRWLRYDCVETFYRRSHGSWYAAEHLAYLFGKQGRVDEAADLLQPYADGAHGEEPRTAAANRLNCLLATHERIDELRARAAAGDQGAEGWLNGVLARHGRLDELDARTDATGRLIVTVPPDDPWAYGGYQSVSLDVALARYGRVEELWARARTGNNNATQRLAYLLAERGQEEEAIELLRPLADSGSPRAAERLAELLAGQGRIDELRTRHDAGDHHATSQLARVLVDQGRLAEAITLLQNGSGPGHLARARVLQSNLLAEQGRVDELQERATAGEWRAVLHWADVLAMRGQVDEAIEFLQSHADRGNGNASDHLVELLAKCGREEELQNRADIEGDLHAAEQLAEHLAKQGRLDDLRIRAYTGDEHALMQLAKLLIKRGCIQEMIGILLPHSGFGCEVIAELLAEQGLVDEADRLYRFGLTAHGHIAAGPTRRQTRQTARVLHDTAR